MLTSVNAIPKEILQKVRQREPRRNSPFSVREQAVKCHLVKGLAEESNGARSQRQKSPPLLCMGLGEGVKQRFQGTGKTKALES